MAGLGLVVSGEVKSGEVTEGSNGRTAKGKKCAVVKIELGGERISIAEKKSKVSMVLKNIGRTDAKPWDIIYFD